MSQSELTGLPTEIWREVAARRQRYEDVRSKLVSGEITSINDFITYNLDIRQFAQDVIENCEGPELLRAFYHAIEKVTVLDPTCGSGAFLFAALNILEPLYEACLDRMQAFLDDLERSGKKHRPEKFSDFRKILRRIEDHPNRQYFILKSIIINNLYGVDIMDEAVEIAKLRFFLKLMAQIDKVEDIKPLPDIDFNIKAGNTLVGFSSYDEVNKYVSGKFDFDNAMASIEEKAEEIDWLFKLFRNMQTEEGMKAKDFVKAKHKLQTKLIKLEEELNGYLAGEYGVNVGKKRNYDTWLSSYKPFHWYIEFYSIIKDGGFDVIIGNPPYVEYSKVKNEYIVKNYETEKCANLYAYIIEKCFLILNEYSLLSMIVQLPIVCTDRMKPLQNLCKNQSKNIWLANFDDRPAKLFDGLEHIRATILISRKNHHKQSSVLSTYYNRWYSETRSFLFENITFDNVMDLVMDGSIPKIGSSVGRSIFQKIQRKHSIGRLKSQSSSNIVYFHNAPQYWIRAMNRTSYFWNERDGEKTSTQVKPLRIANRLNSYIIAATLNSSLFYWWFIILSDCRHLNLREIDTFGIGLENMPDNVKITIEKLNKLLMHDFNKNAKRKETYYKTSGKVVYDEFYPKHSKAIIDEIDKVLAQHYGFTDEELDFIINYDIKYRMGKDNL